GVRGPVRDVFSGRPVHPARRTRAVVSVVVRLTPTGRLVLAPPGASFYGTLHACITSLAGGFLRYSANLSKNSGSSPPQPRNRLHGPQANDRTHCPQVGGLGQHE